MNKPLEWIIHYVQNGSCECCGKEEHSFIPFTCNAHTHGMERYDNHQDFQMVLDCGPEQICYILNSLGVMVQSGHRFSAGDLVEGIFTDCSVRLDEFEETGRKVLRVVIPDANNKFPDEADCREEYKLQLLSTDDLCVEE